MASPGGEKKHPRRQPTRFLTTTASKCWFLLLLILFALLFVNFSAGVMNKDRGRSSTPDQSYEPRFPDDKKATFGVIYAANGPFVERAFVSALGFGGGANVTIFSDSAGVASCALLVRRHRKAYKSEQAIDCRVANATSAWGFREAKLWAFTATPYDKTLYLDADAYPCADFQWLHGELSMALERYEVMATHSSMRRGYAHALHWLNAGIIAFDSRSPNARLVFQKWLADYKSGNSQTDQRIFNEAVLAVDDVKTMVLPPEFNCKSNYKSVRYSWAKVLSPFFYRKIRKDWPCCQIESVGKCVVDHECHFPPLPPKMTTSGGSRKRQ